MVGVVPRRHHPVFRVLRHLDEFFVRSGRARDKHGGAEAGIDQEIAHQVLPVTLARADRCRRYRHCSALTPRDFVADIFVACTAACTAASSIRQMYVCRATILLRGEAMLSSMHS